MRLLRRTLRAILLTLMLTLCAGLFYLLVIMGDTPGGDTSATPEATSAPLASMPQPKLSFSADNLRQAEVFFNAPVLRLSQESGWRLTEVIVSDSSPGDMQASVREIRLLYVDSTTNASIYVSSLTPASAVRALPSRGFFAAADQAFTLLGQRSVLMRSGDTLHVHLQKGDVLYQIEGVIELDRLRHAADSAEI